MTLMKLLLSWVSRKELLIKRSLPIAKNYPPCHTALTVFTYIPAEDMEESYPLLLRLLTLPVLDKFSLD